jgi:isopenicillin N synthase-like dioxygenase
MPKIGAEVAPDNPKAGDFLHGPNLWPSSLENSHFQAPLMSYLSQMTKVAELLLEMLRQTLPGPPPPDMFQDFQVQPSTNLRLLHYPPQKSVDQRQLGGKLPYIEV